MMFLICYDSVNQANLPKKNNNNDNINTTHFEFPRSIDFKNIYTLFLSYLLLLVL